MRYIQPYGSTDIDADYVNGNPAIGLRGSIPPAEMVEHPMREIVNLLEYSNIDSDPVDLHQFLRAVRSQRVNYIKDWGTVPNELVVTFTPRFTELTAGLVIRVKVAFTNTGAASIQVDGIGPVPILRANGANLNGGDLQLGEVVTLVYDGSYFQIMNYQGYNVQTINNEYYTIHVPYVADTSGAANTIVAPFNPAITSLSAGKLISVKVANANTSATTIVVNSLPAKNVVTGDQQNLIAGQIVAGVVAYLVYDGSQFQLVNPVIPRQVSIEGIQIVKRQIYQDPDYHVLPTPNVQNQEQWKISCEVFRVNYAPVGAGNRVYVQFTGAARLQMEYDPYGNPTPYSMNGTIVHGYLSYSLDNGQTWHPPDYGIWSPTDFVGWTPVGDFATNPAMMAFFTKTATTRRAEFNIIAVGEMVVPAGPPANIIFRLNFASAIPGMPWTIMHGGTIAEMVEYAEQ